MNNLSAQSLGLACTAHMQYSVAEPKSARYKEARRALDQLLSQMAALTDLEREFIFCRFLRKLPGPARIGEVAFPVDRRGKQGFTMGGGYTYDHIFSY